MTRSVKLAKFREKKINEKNKCGFPRNSVIFFVNFNAFSWICEDFPTFTNMFLYNFELYRFKVKTFFLRHSVVALCG